MLKKKKYMTETDDTEIDQKRPTKKRVFSLKLLE